MEALAGRGFVAGRIQSRSGPRQRRAVVHVAASGNAGGGSKRKGKKQGGAFSTMEAAIGFLASLLSAGDMFGTTGSSFRDDATFDATDDGADKKVELRGWKWIKISGKAKTSTRVATVADAPLDAYLQLPAEDYSLLDPQFVSRESPTTFRFTVPMREVIKKDSSYGGPGEILKELTPTILFTTEVDTARQKVQLVGNGAALGQADLDTRFELELKRIAFRKPQDRTTRGSSGATLSQKETTAKFSADGTCAFVRNVAFMYAPALFSSAPGTARV